MKKATAIEITILFIIGLFPLLLLKPGHIISIGDEFPLFVNPQNSLSNGLFMWSPNFLGYATALPSCAFYLYPGAFLSGLGLGVGNVEVLFQTLLFMAAGLSMYYFARTIYPEVKFAAFIAGFFYMFNFFALDNMNNIGFVWTCAFLPLLLTLFVKIMNAVLQQNKKTSNRNIIYFALASVVAFSFASINPANVVLMLFGLSILAVYYLVRFRLELRQYLLTFAKIAALSIPINLWWVIPMLNYYYLSSSNFNSAVSVDAFSWTQFRSSFLNLFWLNGFWGWRLEYEPSYITYTKSVISPLLTILVYVPFLIAASALLFKSAKARFNLYIMASILVLLFLAKGLHDPLDSLNSALYKIPFASMFREPVSKFTLLIVPFLALLIGFAAGNIANIPKFRIRRISIRASKLLVISLLLIIFVAAVIPLAIAPIINPKSTMLPEAISPSDSNLVDVNTPVENVTFPSSIQIPNYWYQATNWINTQQGNWKVLLTPMDDYYQMPYAWSSRSDEGNYSNAYYGTDQLVDNLINKPVISTDYLDGYKVNPDTAATLQELRYTVYFNKTGDFKALLDLLNIKYIIQRNDVISYMGNRSFPSAGEVAGSPWGLMSQIDMKSFFEKQPYIQLVQKFGQLEIYEYSYCQPSVYAISSSSLQQSNISVETNVTIVKDWNFNNSTAVNDWQVTPDLKESGRSVFSKNSIPGNFSATILNANDEDWVTFESPLLATHFSIYTIGVGANASGENTIVKIRFIQYTANMAVIADYSNLLVGWGNFSSRGTPSEFNLVPLRVTQYFSIQLLFGIEQNKTGSGTLWLDDVNVTDISYTLSTAGLDSLFNSEVQNQAASILNVQNVNPTKIVATVNATHPFILATSNAFDGSWAARLNGEIVKPSSLYLGLKGFLINQTGEFDVTIEYEPQTWFFYASVISISTVVTICVLFMHINRENIQVIFKNKNKQVK